MNDGAGHEECVDGSCEVCADIALKAEGITRIRELYRAIRGVMIFARAYREESVMIGDVLDFRVADCVKQVNVYRQRIRAIRRVMLGRVDALRDIRTASTLPAPPEVAA